MDAVDTWGELLFGRRLRLRVLLWVDEQTDAFNQSQAAVGVAYNSSGEVAKELERLVELEMLTKFGRESRRAPQKYSRREHPGWAIASAVRGALGMPQVVRDDTVMLKAIDGESATTHVGGGTPHEQRKEVRRRNPV